VSAQNTGKGHYIGAPVSRASAKSRSVRVSAELRPDLPCPDCEITHPWRDHSDPAVEDVDDPTIDELTGTDDDWDEITAGEQREVVRRLRVERDAAIRRAETAEAERDAALSGMAQGQRTIERMLSDPALRSQESQKPPETEDR